MFKVQVRWANGSVSEFAVDKEVVTLGRAPESDIFLPSTQASREHAKVYRNGEQIFIEDLQSANGTFIRQQRIRLPAAVSGEDPIKLGDVFVRVTYEENAKPITDSGSYSVAQRLGDRKKTVHINANMGADLRKMLDSGLPGDPKKKK